MRAVVLACGLVFVSLALSTSGCSASGGSGGSGAKGGAVGSGGSGGSGNASSGGSGNLSSGDGEIGSACVTNDDCVNPPDAECFTTIGGGPVPTITFPGGFCSKACDPESTENQCGDKAGCSSIGSSSGGVSTTLSMCSPPCASDAECRMSEGYKCFQILPGYGICVPP